MDMNTEQLAFVQGWDDTRAALGRWRRRPSVVLRPWLAGALAVAVLLLLATLVVALLSTPDPSGSSFPGVDHPVTTGDLIYVLERNGLVLALHSLACVAGFMAGSSLPQVAKGYTGWKRRLHEHAGPAAIVFVAVATTFSLATQAFVLGHEASTLAAELQISPPLLLVGLLPHALPELTALFLPLAAWTIASRSGAWKDLLAATMVTTALAAPVLVATAFIETRVTPHVLLSLL
jgi:Stage II sporulation protein M